MTLRHAISSLVVLAGLAGCSFVGPPYEPDPRPLDASRLPVPDVAARVGQLGPCTEAPDRTLSLNASLPVTVLVHGCNGSAGRFRELAQLYAFHGQQAVCFEYDDRLSLVQASSQLLVALDRLTAEVPGREVTVIGHSMGGLIARKAMEAGTRGSGSSARPYNLATVSAPVAGIAVARHCGSTWLKYLSLGAVPGICWMISGDNWFEITDSSPFIRQPGPLAPEVRRFLKVVTDERGTCRRRVLGMCVESDNVFSLPEQYNPVIDEYARVTNVEVGAGHVEIVGYRNVPPRKLVAILQDQGLMAPTPPPRRAAFERLLAELY